ncbi:hypothetical protein DND132_3288 [Pseudodesulfovibrio mercurii]|uniref:Uncharacterized protein n=1 Tax=Pseudodesulfovibrio mercurii TaxID=641491 RepID=F0JKP2_9BACT|nr:hypothetical protein [Pseudodesulfovibrio mercurii]EGB16491.1 hypothetical protein DND132_3288 [Pseudodesulfovibrio mercurii]
MAVNTDSIQSAMPLLKQKGVSEDYILAYIVALESAGAGNENPSSVFNTMLRALAEAKPSS